jgi:hypothetical protein
MTPESRIDAALAFLDRCEALTVAPESWAGVPVLEVVHRMVRSVRARLDPAPVTTSSDQTGPPDFYRAARTQLRANAPTSEEPA